MERGFQFTVNVLERVAKLHDTNYATVNIVYLAIVCPILIVLAIVLAFF